MRKKKLIAGATLAIVLTLTAGLPQIAAGTESSQGAATINGPQVLPPV